MQSRQNETQFQKLLKLGVTQRHAFGFCHLRLYHTVATDCEIEKTNGGIILVDAEYRNAVGNYSCLTSRLRIGAYSDVASNLLLGCVDSLVFFLAFD